MLVTSQKETILSECADMIRNNETEKLQLMFKLMDRVPDEGITPMLNDLEAHIRASGIADMVSLLIFCLIVLRNVREMLMHETKQITLVSTCGGRAV